MSPNPNCIPLQAVVDGSRTSVRFPAGTALTESNARDVGQHLAALAAGCDRPHLALDLGGVSILTSVALAELISLNRKVRDAGGRLTLENATPGVRQVFRITRLDTILEFRDAIPA